MKRVFLIGTAIVLDCIFGDPYWLYHPVQLIGKAISKLKKIMQNICKREEGIQKKKEIAAGGFLAGMIVAGTYMAAYGSLYLVFHLHPAVGIVLEVFWMYQILAAKCLKVESDKVYRNLADKDIDKARISVSYLVGRDTDNLSEEEIAKACVETVAENTTDGVIAPLFYLFCGGVPLAMAYKAVNTLDSMVGYRNEEFEYLGKASAKLDDIVNYIPARLAAWSMLAACFLLKMNGRLAWKTYLADRGAHLSPNCAQTEAVAAGALEIQLGGTHDYFGKPVRKPTIGQSVKICDETKIKDAQKLMYGSLLLCFCMFSLVYFGLQTLVM
ncbi:MAG: adenosylcobinamide-phosphate synthase CbiB [Lachnospiraceae bacterium]|nr:adenosylcobinamide-phosphate synthase CbiB [Lachnospiraceae bacterium]